MSGSSTTTALAEAEKRTVTVTSSNGDPVVYDGNPAALAGARYETEQCFRRLGAFELLVQHNAARLTNGTIATEDASSIPFVLNLISDPHQDSYSERRSWSKTTLTPRFLVLDAGRCKGSAHGRICEPYARLLPAACISARPVTYMRCSGALVSCSIEFCVTL